MERNDIIVWAVIMNREEQYSIWPVDRPSLTGWVQVGFYGSKAECVAWVGENWTDPRPISMQQEMEPGD